MDADELYGPELIDGAALDEAIAREVMGWTLDGLQWIDAEGDGSAVWRWTPSLHLNQAWQAIEAAVNLIPETAEVTLRVSYPGKNSEGDEKAITVTIETWYQEIHEWADHIEVALCRAALSAARSLKASSTVQNTPAGAIENGDAEANAASQATQPTSGASDVPAPQNRS